MPAMKCIDCDRWSFREGCSLHSYCLMRDCMMDRKDYFREKKTKENVYENNNRMPDAPSMESQL